MTARPVHLAAVGDVNDVSTWSGTPYHLLQAAGQAGLINTGLALEPMQTGRQLRRYLWNLGAVLRGRGHGGYQFSTACLERLWRPWRGALVNSRIINCFQLFAPSIVADDRIERWYYIDQTMQQYFDDYGLRDSVSPWMADDILRRECEGYSRAAGIITHSHWAAQSVIHDCGIAAEKVHVVVPGANLDTAIYAQWCSGRASSRRDAAQALQLVFVGKDPIRKGLDRLIRALTLARARGADCRLRILGCRPERVPVELRQAEGIEWLGFIDKQKRLADFMDAVANADVGCLLSHAEAGGMVLREYHALGLGVIGPDVGGSPDHVIPEAAYLFTPQASDEEIAALLLRLSRDREEVRRMRAVSWARREEVSWQSSVSKLAALWT